MVHLVDASVHERRAMEQDVPEIEGTLGDEGVDGQLDQQFLSPQELVCFRQPIASLDAIPKPLKHWTA